jgi:glycerol-3-phosphate acyltransferase PlsY
MYDFVFVIVGYLLGSIPFGLLIPKLFGVGDVRKIGSGNIGATNVLRTAGAFPAIIVAVLDILKGSIPVILVMYFGGGYILDLEYVKLIAGGAAIIGHIFPIFLYFKGGKGVNTALGVFIVLVPIATIAAILIFSITVVISRYVSLGSILASIAFFLVILLSRAMDINQIHIIYVPTAVVLVALILYTHHTNIKRLISGRENKISFKSQTISEAEDNG